MFLVPSESISGFLECRSNSRYRGCRTFPSISVGFCNVDQNSLGSLVGDEYINGFL